MEAETVVAEKRTYNNGVEYFVIQNIYTKRIREATKEQFRKELKFGIIACINYKLTSDGKIVQRTQGEINRIINLENSVPRANNNNSGEPQKEFTYNSNRF